VKLQKQNCLTRQLRVRQTETEAILWSKLRDRKFEGTKIRRQQQINSYIVDFVSLEEKIIIEVDGGQHNEEASIKKDDLRTNTLEKEGYQVLRFWNSDVTDNLDGVLNKIKEALDNIREAREGRQHPHL
jgi:very-short-patch-repair endonuclease